MKPMLAEDFDESKLRFPLIAQPKTDGVRSLHITGGLTGRSLKPHKNRYVTAQFSDPRYAGLDGEMFRGPKSNITAQSLCRDTSSDLGTIKGEPQVCWKAFDFVNPVSILLPYMFRLEGLRNKVEQMNDPRVFVVESHVCETLEHLLSLEDHWLIEGYEGACIRDPMGMHKEGRSTVKEGGLLRIKRFVDAEALVTGIEEGNQNENEATVGLLGQTERSSHQENMVPNGMVGALLCTEILTGLPIRVSAGEMDHDTRKLYFERPELIVQKMITFKHFPKGRKVQPRFATFKCIRNAEDMS